MPSDLSPHARTASSRAAAAAEARAVALALHSPRQAVWIGTVGLLALALAVGVAVATEESLGLGLLAGAVMTVVALGLPWLLRGVLRQRLTDRVEPLAGELAQAPSAEGTYGHLLGTARVNVPSHWRAYLPEGRPVRAEGLRVEVPGRAPVYHLVTADSPMVDRGPLSVGREVQAGLSGLYRSGPQALVLLGVPLLVAGLGLAAVFSGVGSRTSVPEWAIGSSVLAGVGLLTMLAGAIPLVRLRSQAWALYHDTTTPSPPVVGRTAWTVAAWGALAMALGLRLFGVPLWGGALVGAVGFLPVGVLAALRPAPATP